MSAFCEVPGALRQTLVMISQSTAIWLQTQSHFRKLSVPLPPAFSFHYTLLATAFDPSQIRVGKRTLGENVTQMPEIQLDPRGHFLRASQILLARLWLDFSNR